MNIVRILPLILVFIIEGLVYKEVVYDELLPLLDEPYKTLLGVGIALATLAGNFILLSKLFYSNSD